MYRVAIIVNENETLHSVYADAELVLKKALEKIYGDKVDDLYSFEIFDKFNIKMLFTDGPKNLFTFDSLIIATNACNNKEIYDELVINKSSISLFIDDGAGNNHGLCILNQQKLGDSVTNAKYIGFLPNLYSYKLIRRPEKQSAEGSVTIKADYDLIINFPIGIDNDIIKCCCNGENNQFMPHKYRFIIEPQTQSSYDVIYEDKTYCSQKEKSPRQLLLKSRVGNERVIISSVILDWAEHLEQLANILVFITEGINQFAFVKKEGVTNKRFSRYIKKARDYRIALKEYNELELMSVFTGLIEGEQSGKSGKQKQLYPHSVFVFSNNWSEDEVQTLWDTYAKQLKKDIVFYRLVSDSSSTKSELVLVSSFSKSITNSHMFLTAEEWLSANYITSKWRKSIWTYEYVLYLYDCLSFETTGYIEPVYLELLGHNKIKSGVPADLDFTRLRNKVLLENLEYQSYDNVFNSTCSCCNVLGKLYSLAKKNNKKTLRLNNEDVDISVLTKNRNQCGNWIVYKLNHIDYCKKISWQDRLMAFVALYDSGYFSYVERNNPKLYALLINELKESNSVLKKIIITINNLDYRIDPSVSVADLCKILRYIYIVNILAPSSIPAEKYVNTIESHLQSIQSYNGEWKNLSETSEMSIALLARINYEWKYKTTSLYESMINRSVNYIQNNFDYSRNCWLGDENTTAKSLFAIWLYDQMYNFTFDDFLINLINSTERINPVFNVNNNINALDYAQEHYNQLLQEKKKVDQELKSLEENQKYTKKLITKYKLIVTFTSMMAGISILFSVCVLGTLASSYPTQWKAIISNNVTLIIATVLGLVVTSIITGFAQHTKKKLIEDFKDED